MYKVDNNTDEHKFRRHYFGKFLLEQLNGGWRCLNYDESSLDHFNCYSRAWCRRGKKVGDFIAPVAPRITLVAAVDNLGNSYLSLLQTNSNRHTTLLLLSQLFDLLSQEDPHWKESTIIIIDGARYHTTPSIRAMFRLHGVSHCITSPHSPQLAPIELYFSMLKQGELNPKDLPSSKK
jgi:hypothetical protein